MNRVWHFVKVWVHAYGPELAAIAIILAVLDYISR